MRRGDPAPGNENFATVFQLERGNDLVPALAHLAVGTTEYVSTRY